MKKFLILFGLSATVLITLIALAMVLVPIYFNPNDYKDDIASLVQKQTGRSLSFNGDIALSVFPWLGVELGPVALSNAEGFSTEPFVEAKHTSIKVKLLPLINKDVQVKHVNVDGLTLRLAKNAKGITNWADLAATSESTGKAAPKAPSTSKTLEQSALPVASLAVGGISIRDAKVAWDDASTGQRYRMAALDLATGPLAPGRPFDFILSGTGVSDTPRLSGNIRLAATAEIAPDFSRHSLKNAALDLAVTGDDIPGGTIETELAADILIDLNSNSISVDGLALKTADLNVTGDVKIKNFDAAPKVAANLNVKEFNPRALMDTFGVTAPELTDPATLQRAAFTVSADATSTSVDIKSLDLLLDDTRLSGSIRIGNFDKPEVAFNLTADTLDVNRYLPPQTEDEADANGKNATASTKDNEETSAGLPKDLLRSMNVDGTLHVGSLTVHRLHMQDVEVGVRALDGLIRISPFTAGIFGGRIHSDLTTDMRTDITRSAMTAGIENLALGSALKEFAGEDYVIANTNATLNLTGQGEDWSTLSRTLSGKGSVALTDGVFKGFQIIPEPVRNAAYEHDPQNRTHKVEKMQPFRSISANLTVQNGLISTGDTVLTARNLNGIGNGTLNLADNWLDYQTEIQIMPLPAIPFHVKGPVTDPDFTLDKTAFLKNTALGIVNTPVDIGKKAIGIGKDVGKDVGQGTIDLGKDVIEGIGKGIKGIFGGSKN